MQVCCQALNCIDVNYRYSIFIYDLCVNACFVFLIAQLEKSLKSQIEPWEAAQGTEFLVRGQRFMQYVEEQWNLHQLEKEREKLERVTNDCI